MNCTTRRDYIHEKYVGGGGGGYHSRSDLAARWGCSEQTVINYEKAAKLPRFIVGKRMVRYSMEDIERLEGRQFLFRLARRTTDAK
jgi:hypothetical protein